MLRQPADAPPPSGTSATATPWSLRRVRSERMRRQAVAARLGRTRLGSIGPSPPAGAGGATEAVAAQCDLLVDRLAAQEAVTADVAAPSARSRAAAGRGRASATQLGGTAGYRSVNRPVAVVMGCHWLDRQSELAFVTRSLAGAAASRAARSPSWSRATRAEREADGVFDLQGMGGPERCGGRTMCRRTRRHCGRAHARRRRSAHPDEHRCSSSRAADDAPRAGLAPAAAGRR